MRREIFTIPKRPTNKVKNIWNIEHIEIQNTEMNSICLRGWRSDGVRFVSLATCMSEHIRKLILPWIRLYFVGEIHTHFFLLWLCSLHIIFRFTLKRFGVHFPFVSNVVNIVWLRKCFVHLLLLLPSFFCVIHTLWCWYWCCRARLFHHSLN